MGAGQWDGSAVVGCSTNLERRLTVNRKGLAKWKGLEGPEPRLHLSGGAETQDRRDKVQRLTNRSSER